MCVLRQYTVASRWRFLRTTTITIQLRKCVTSLVLITDALPVHQCVTTSLQSWVHFRYSWDCTSVGGYFPFSCRPLLAQTSRDCIKGRLFFNNSTVSRSIAQQRVLSYVDRKPVILDTQRYNVTLRVPVDASTPNSPSEKHACPSLSVGCVLTLFCTCFSFVFTFWCFIENVYVNDRNSAVS